MKYYQHTPECCIYHTLQCKNIVVGGVVVEGVVVVVVVVDAVVVVAAVDDLASAYWEASPSHTPSLVLELGWTGQMNSSWKRRRTWAGKIGKSLRRRWRSTRLMK